MISSSVNTVATQEGPWAGEVASHTPSCLPPLLAASRTVPSARMLTFLAWSTAFRALEIDTLQTD
jgi:hypothetical protein